MVATQITTEIIDSPRLIESSFGETSYDLLKAVGRQALIQVDRLSSRSTEYNKLTLISPANIRFTPRADSLAVILRPSVSSGLSPFPTTRSDLLGVATTTHESPFWSSELEGTELHTLVVRRSLLAKHAFGIVDTSVLESAEVLTLDQTRSDLLLGRIGQIVNSTDSTQALDIRLTHVLLSICEIANHQVDDQGQNQIQRTIWQVLRDKNAQELTLEVLMESCDLSEHQLNHFFKKNTGFSPRQFLSSFKLNRIRQDLHNRGRRYADCVAEYGYDSPDQLYRAYQRLFSEEPPLNTH